MRGRRTWLALVGAALLAACAAGSTRTGVEAGPEGEGAISPPPGAVPDSGEIREGDADSLLLLPGAADSLLAAASRPASLSEEALLRSAAGLVFLGREPTAARLLLTAFPREREEAGALLRRAVEGCSTAELMELARLAEPGTRMAAVVQAEFARALALEGRTEAAREVASRAAGGRMEDPERRKLRAVESGEVAPFVAPLRVGVLLPLSGRFEMVGQQLLDGVRLALSIPADSSGRLPKVEMIVLDDSSRVETVPGLVRALADSGVVAVIGPVRSEALREGAAARSYGGLTLLSPTASRDSLAGANAVSLWNRADRARAPAAAVGRWVTSELGLRNLSALVVRTDEGRIGLEAFASVADSTGADLLSVRWFDPDSTTFEEPIRALATDSPQAVLVLAESGRQVLQVAPQLVYYGLRTAVIAGGDAWSEPEVLRRLDPVFGNFRVLGTLADRTRRGGAWSVLREAWEREYREALPETVFPALGWDAARLLRAALPQDGLPRAGVVARRLRTLHDVVGATGTIDVDSVTGRPRRRAEVRMILDGALVAPDTAAIRESVERARLLEERLREAEEEKEKAAGEEGADPGARPR